MTNIIIDAKDLSAGYGGKKIWQGANFTVSKGEFVGLLGPNGAGKTTLFRLLLGLAKPAAGSLQLFGSAPHRGNPRIGYIPQRRPIDSEVRIEALELVRLGMKGTKWGFSTARQTVEEREQALQALKLVDAESLAHCSLGQLSGGELQRVFLAQALISKPDLLLLDEPLANLDIRREMGFVQLINGVIRSEHIAVLLIAHDINPLLPAIDRIIYIANGRVASGQPKDIVTTKSLSALYGASVEVLHDSRGRVAVLGTEEAVHNHE
jgi:zinc/manganese transport system ATP-binding protein